MSNFKKYLNKLNPKVLARIGDDFRQGGSLIGAGVTGMILLSDDVSNSEGIIIIAIGLFIWIIGHICLYISELIERNNP